MTTQPAPIPAPPASNVPVATVRINPPADVTEALANLQAACARWTPVPVKSASFGTILNGGSGPEAAACNAIPDVSAFLWVALILGAVVGVLGWVIFSKVCRLLWRLVGGAYQRLRAPDFRMRDVS